MRRDRSGRRRPSLRDRSPCGLPVRSFAPSALTARSLAFQARYEIKGRTFLSLAAKAVFGLSGLTSFSYLNPMKRFGIVLLISCLSLVSSAQRNRVSRIDLRDEVLKVEMLSPWLGGVSLGYEWMLKPGLNAEIGLCAIGNGFGELAQGVRGLALKAGPKFLVDYFRQAEDMQRSEPFGGLYIQPLLVVVHFRGEGNSVTGMDLENGTSAGILLIFGEQWVIGKRWLLDIGAGVGVGTGRIRRASSPSQPDGRRDIGSNYYYSHIYLGSQQPFTFAGNFSLGYLIR